MEIKELMIGDWVNTPNGNYRVTAIQDNDVIFTDYSDNIDGAVDIDEVNPIKLTPEILEKNGFVKDPMVSDEPPYDKDEEGNMHFSLNGSFWGWWQPNNIFSIPANALGWLEFKYVHELQHALKLCRIEKTIEL